MIVCQRSEQARYTLINPSTETMSRTNANSRLFALRAYGCAIRRSPKLQSNFAGAAVPGIANSPDAPTARRGWWV